MLNPKFSLAADWNASLNYYPLHLYHVHSIPLDFDGNKKSLIEPIHYHQTISGTKGSNMSLESSDLGRGGGDNQV